MATANIKVNLLSERKQLLKERRLLVARVQLIAGVALVVYITVLLIVVGFGATVTAKMNRLEDEIKEEKLKIAQQRQREAMLTVLGNKIDLADDFVSNRKELRAVFEKVLAMLPEGAVLTSFKINDQAGTIDLQISSESMYVTVELLNSFEEQIAQGVYKYIAVGSFSRADTGRYSLNGEIPL